MSIDVKPRITPLRNFASSELQNVRERKPLIHCVTNQVVMNWTANVLYALGASPLMSHAPEESSDLAKIRQGLVVNIGTLTHSWLQDLKQIVSDEKKQRGDSPVAILDPVGAGATVFRTENARDLLASGAFRILRGNAFEIMSVAGEKARGSGVDSLEASGQALAAAQSLAQEHDLIVVVSGATDWVTDGKRLLSLNNGTPLLTQVTGTGCSLNAVIAAFVAVAEPTEYFSAVAAAVSVFNIAGEKAATTAKGPGSFAVQFLDELTNLEPRHLDLLTGSEVEE